MSLTTPEDAAVMLKAADVIEARGWYQGGFAPEGADSATCPVDVIGALNVALGHHPRACSYAAATVAMRLAAYLDLACDRGQIAEVLSVGWNDDEDRDAGQVIEALRRCAAS